MKKYEYVLLDLDNTIFDTRKTELMAITELIISLGLKTRLNELIPIYKTINNNAWKNLEAGNVTIAEINNSRFTEFFKEADIDADSNQASDEYLHLLAKHNQYFPDAERVYLYLTEKYQVILITNGLKTAQNLRIKDSFIDLDKSPLFTAEDLGTNKPDPVVIDVISSKMNWQDKSKMIIIGDSLRSDIQCAENAGIASIWCNFIDQVAGDYKPDYRVNSLKDILEIL